MWAGTINCESNLPGLIVKLLTLGAHAHSEGYSSCRVCMCVFVYV